MVILVAGSKNIKLVMKSGEFANAWRDDSLDVVPLELVPLNPDDVWIGETGATDSGFGHST